MAREPFPAGRSSCEGIVDFAARRAIAREDSDQPIPILMLFDGPCCSPQQLHSDGWREPAIELVAGAPRAPAALALFDYVRAESIIDVVELDRGEVEDAAEAYRVSLDVGRIQWPGPPAARFGNSVLARLASRTRPNARPKGVLGATLWIDTTGRVSRFTYGPPESRDIGYDTQLWDFGRPPPIGDWRSQAVIDPMTLKPAVSPAEALRRATGTDQ